ncbi:MAG: hypothetical protein ACR2H5_09540 [Ktedonobacteraceae bacterium]
MSAQTTRILLYLSLGGWQKLLPPWRQELLPPIHKTLRTAVDSEKSSIPE